MRSIYFFAIFFVLTVIFSGCKTTQVVLPDQQVKKPPVPRPTSELRGLLVSPESWKNDDVDKMISNIHVIMEGAADANYNAIFFMARNKGESYYHSPLDFWSKNLNENPGFDPLALAIDAAHSNDLKFYAGINLLSIGNENDPPGNPQHLYHKHGPGAPADSSWMSMEQDGKTAWINGVCHLNPALPQVKTYLKQVVLHLTENYNIDGISFDQTGYLPGNFSFDKFSIEKFNANILVTPVSREEWAKERLTDLMEDVAVEAMLVKPYLMNSVIFSTGNEDQFILDWLSGGIVDILVPNIEINVNDPVQELKTWWNENQKTKEIAAYVFPLLSLSEVIIDEDKLSRPVSFMRENGGRGMLWRLDGQENSTIIPNHLPYKYVDKIAFPDSLKQVTPEQVVGLDVSAIYPENKSGQIVRFFEQNKSKTTDSEGHFGLITSNPDTISFETSNRSVVLPTRRWAIPYKYVIQSDNSIGRETPWVEFRRMPARFTDNPEYHLLCKTEYPASAWINDDSVKIYKTGVFFNKITLNEGSNRVRASVMTQDSLSTFYEREFVYTEVDKTRQAFPLWIDERSVTPKMDLELLPEDIVKIGFHGSLSQKAFINVNPGSLRLECSRDDHEDYSLYQVDLPLRKLKVGFSYELSLELLGTTDSLQNQTYEYTLQNTVKVREPYDFPIVKTVEDNSRLTYNLGPVRLGGPIRSELSAGIIMKTNGKIGDNYRIRLNRVENGIIHQNYVKELPAETIQPTYFISSMSCAPTVNGDILSIPYLEPIPYAVYPDPDQNRIVITLFGAKTSSTWITHRKGRKIIDKVTWQQTTPETYEVYVNLKTPNIWGYDIRPNGKQLLLRIKNVPEYNLKNEKPLKGLKIAIEAGHGGRSIGAVGLSGLQEKDINLDLSHTLGEVCKSMGAEILQVRDTDKSMSLIEKRDIARYSDADLLISIHANAAGTRRGYLRVPGTSTYYNNPFWAPLAESIYDRLLEIELEEFGVIGSFNYTVIRVSQMPSILVEQAFMTHAEDEEKLADDEFRQRMAEKIYEGIVDYLEYMNE